MSLSSKNAKSSKHPNAPHKPRGAEATLESLYRIFTVPEGETSTLGRIDREISTNLAGFLSENIVASDVVPSDLERDFLDTKIPDDPIFVSEQAEFLLKKVVAQSVHVSAPSFVGHMTSAIPYFMLPLAKIMMALNQNLVKIETSKAFTPLERQVLGMLHRLVYEKDSAFYKNKTQNPNYGLGAFCSGGTIANLTALWVALNQKFPKDASFDGVGDEGLAAALSYYGYKKAVVLVSSRGHYSLSKAANLLGIGRKNLVTIPCDDDNKIRLDLLDQEICRLQEASVAVVAVVGIAGTTETGNIDPLQKMAALCQHHQVFFHVDAAWGGPSLCSDKHRPLLAGIEQADSVTLDAHKQLYVPMGAGMVVFKNPKAMNIIEHHAAYIIRKGSRDLGCKTLEGSRPGMAMLVHSGLRIIGRKGYELLVDLGIEKARWFADYIKAQDDFELITEPELNILTYRFIPKPWRQNLVDATEDEWVRINNAVNQLTITIQKDQRESGRTFVSRTTLTPMRYHKAQVTVFRVVLANPLTTEPLLMDMIAEQRRIGLKLLAAT